MIIQIIKLKSSLHEDEVIRIAEERAAEFRKVPGLMQKYYVISDEHHTYAGIYIWDSRDSMMAFRETELAATIPKAYKVLEPPNIQVLDGVFQLRM